MTFAWSTEATLLFDWAKVGPDVLTFAVGLAVVVALGVARQELLRMSEDETQTQRNRVALYFCQATLSYLLMLVAMTFNVLMFLAVIAGLTIGHYRSLMNKAKVADCCA